MTFRITYSVLDADMTEVHKAFDAALERVRGQLGVEIPSWVAGEPVRTGRFLVSDNPSRTSEILAKAHEATMDHVDQAMVAARAAQRIWAQTPWQEKVATVRRAADLISERRMEYSAVMAMEVGKNRLESMGDVEESADLLRYYAGQLEAMEGGVKPLQKL